MERTAQRTASHPASAWQRRVRGAHADRERINEQFGEAEEALVERAQGGDPASYDALVRANYSRVLHLVSSYLRDPQDALEITQEAFLRAHLALPGFRRECSYFTWLFVIAVNAAKNRLKARRHEWAAAALEIGEADGSGFSEPSDQESPDRLLLRNELSEGLLKAIEKLPRELGAAFVFRDIELLAYHDIAARMRCPIGTVRSRIFRARAAIKKSLKVLVE